MKQNLILFFEENNDVIDINSKLVRQYMNRSVIDEEDQTEISEIYLLTKSDGNAKSIGFYQDIPPLPDFLKDTYSFHDTYGQIRRTESEKDPVDFQLQMDKIKNDKITFEQSVSKMIESELTRLREQDWFVEWRNEVHENGGMENRSDKKSHLEWLRIKLTQSNNEYTNHFIVGTSFYTSSHMPVRYFTKAFLQDCFQRVTSVQKYKRKHEQIEFSCVSDIIEYNVLYSTMVTVLRGSSTKFLSAEEYKAIHAAPQYENNSITDELEDFHQYNVTTKEFFSKDEFKTLDFYKLLTDCELRKMKFYNEKYEYQYNLCQRFSFPMARFPLSIQTKSLNRVLDYFQNFDEIELINKIDDFTSKMIRQCMNQLVISAEVQFDIDEVYNILLPYFVRTTYRGTAKESKLSSYRFTQFDSWNIGNILYYNIIYYIALSKNE